MVALPSSTAVRPRDFSATRAPQHRGRAGRYSCNGRPKRRCLCSHSEVGASTPSPGAGTLHLRRRRWPRRSTQGSGFHKDARIACGGRTLRVRRRSCLFHYGLLDQVTRQVGCARFDEIVGVAAQVGAALYPKARGRRGEKVRRVDRAQLPVAFRVKSHGRHDADAEAQFDVGLDHVGIEAVSTTCGRGPLLEARLTTSGWRNEVLGHEGYSRPLQGHGSSFAAHAGRHADAAGPRVAGQRTGGMLGNVFGRDAQVARRATFRNRVGFPVERVPLGSGS